MANSDLFVLYDNTQYKTDDWQNRNKIRTKDGWMWLTVPIKHNFGDLIKDVKIDNSKNWQRKHWNSIQANYAKAPYFKKYKDEFEKIYTQKWVLLADFNTSLIKKAAEILGIKTKIVRASENMSLTSKSQQALLDICKHFGAKIYISGADGKKYITSEFQKEFEKYGIKIIYQNYKHPKYKQVHPGFEPYMCILDLIFNLGPESLNVILNQS